MTVLGYCTCVVIARQFALGGSESPALASFLVNSYAVKMSGDFRLLAVLRWGARPGSAGAFDILRHI